MCYNVNTLLQIDRVSVRRGNFLLDQISFSVSAGEAVAILGRTGAGKTLLMETIAGFCRPDQGAVLLRGKPVHQIPVFRRNIGYLYQDLSLFPHMTAGANIGYCLQIQHRPRAEIRDRVREMAERFGIGHILQQYPGTLSGGEQQRVALARALMLQVPLLLLDEPFSALDPVTRTELYTLVRKICREFQCAVVLVTHDFQEATRLADRVGVLLDGRLRGIVPAQELFCAGWDPEARHFLGLEHQAKENEHDSGGILHHTQNQL